MSKIADTPLVPTCLFDASVAPLFSACLYLPSDLNALCWAIDA